MIDQVFVEYLKYWAKSSIDIHDNSKKPFEYP